MMSSNISRPASIIAPPQNINTSTIQQSVIGGSGFQHPPSVIHTSGGQIGGGQIIETTVVENFGQGGINTSTLSSGIQQQPVVETVETTVINGGQGSGVVTTTTTTNTNVGLMQNSGMGGYGSGFGAGAAGVGAIGAIGVAGGAFGQALQADMAGRMSEMGRIRLEKVEHFPSYNLFSMLDDHPPMA